jgi:hypothetical protein
MIITYNGNVLNFGGNIVNFQQPIMFGSLLFGGVSTSNLSISNDIDFRMESGDFTIEWFQYQTDSNSFPRIFAIGDFPSTSIGVSIEGNTFFFWASGSAISFGNVFPYKNQWVHFAITRQGTDLRVFKNGQQIGSTTTNSTNFNNTTSVLRIGNESTTSNGASFGGNITNFHWVKGFAKYTSNFSVPTINITILPETKLLLLSNNESQPVKDSSTLNKTVTNNNTTWSNLTPFN